ncbi:hypothetical protein [Pluralibacter sp.]|jgi:hypothetical protein|uniref:hypothetical protein n=1 Tax=Pluralibacter sp. TaxID=1920032 RepID=UPI0025D5B02E|nr:hypothetical protein [Pluralibacter sp.]MBV8045282.1 hypothetical protein [Pluralibacter sp.]
MKVSSSQPTLMANQAIQSEKTGAVTTGKSSPLAMMMFHCSNVMSPLATTQDRKTSDAHELAYFRQQGCEELLILLEGLPTTPASAALKRSLEALKDRTARPHCLNIAGNLKEARNITPGK